MPISKPPDKQKKPLPAALKPAADGFGDYFYLLGYFVSVFAIAEGKVARLLWALAGVEPPVAQAVFSGVRMDAAIGQITRILDATEVTGAEREVLSASLRQLAAINRMRNDILHYGTHDDGDEYVIDKFVTIHVAERASEIRISLDTLGRMTTDLLVIIGVLLKWWMATGHPSGRATHPALALDDVPHTWLYTPPQPTSPPDKSQRSPARRQRPPSSSPE